MIQFTALHFDSISLTSSDGFYLLLLDEHKKIVYCRSHILAWVDVSFTIATLIESGS